MHVILKPFIKLMIWMLVIFGVAGLAGVDVEGLLSGLGEKIDLENFDLSGLLGGLGG